MHWLPQSWPTHTFFKGIGLPSTLTALEQWVDARQESRSVGR